jgi:hypothetical protein
MSICRHYNKIVKTQRLYDESGIGEGYMDYLTGVRCHIQPSDDSFSEDLDGSFGKNFLMFCRVQDILEGDKIIDGTDEYKVVGEDSYHFNGGDKHTELIIRKFIK